MVAGRIFSEYAAGQQHLKGRGVTSAGILLHTHFDEVEARLGGLAAGFGLGRHAQPLPPALIIIITTVPAPLMEPRGEGLHLDAMVDGEGLAAHRAGLERVEHPFTCSGLTLTRPSTSTFSNSSPWIDSDSVISVVGNTATTLMTRGA